MESSTTFLVETSHSTEPFLHSICESISNFLEAKSDSSRGYFRFNLAHFSRDHSFWGDETVHCDRESVRRAREWMRDWRVSNYLHTPRGAAAQLTGPKTVGALVTALSDQSTQSVYLVSGSSPQEHSNDLVEHTRFASKGRPVHVIFVTGQDRLDLAALETLHLVAKETNGTFRIAYFDDRGRLEQIAHRKGATTRRARTADLFGGASDDYYPVSPSPGRRSSLRSSSSSRVQWARDLLADEDRTGSQSRHGRLTEPSQFFDSPSAGNHYRPPSRANLANIFSNYFVKGQAHPDFAPDSSFQDLKVLPSYYPSKTQQIHVNGVGAGRRRDDDDHTAINLLAIESPISARRKDDQLSGDQMKEIRQMFGELYLDRVNSKKKSARDSGRRSSRKSRDYKRSTRNHSSRHSSRHSTRSLASRSPSTTSSSASTNSEISRDFVTDLTLSQKYLNSARQKLESAANLPKSYRSHGRTPVSSGRGYSPANYSSRRNLSAVRRQSLTTARSVSGVGARRPPSRPGTGRSTTTPSTFGRGLSAEQTTRFTGRRAPPWQPIGHDPSVLSKPLQTDRSKHYTNAWENAQLARQNAWLQRTTTKAVQVDNQGAMARPQSTNERILRPSVNGFNKRTTHSVQTGSPRLEQMETIRELVKQNSTLLKHLESGDLGPAQKEKVAFGRKATWSPKDAERARIQQNRAKVFNRIRAAQNSEQHEWEQLQKSTDGKRMVLDELREMATQRGPMAYTPMNKMAPETSRVKALVEDRTARIQNQMERREDVRRERTQQNYKVMYERMLKEQNNRNAPGNFAQLPPDGHEQQKATAFFVAA